MRVLGVIPARLGSTRLPNKPLQLLAGEPLITRVIQRVMEHDVLQDLVVATDWPMAAQGAGGRPGCAVFDVVARVQGDEPFIPRDALAGAIERVELGDDIGTAAAPLA